MSAESRPVTHHSSLITRHSSLFTPRLRQSSLWDLRHRVVVRRIVEQREPRVREVLEIDDVQRARALIEAVAVLARVESEERAEEEADGRLVRDDQDPLVAVLLDDVQQRWERARRDLQAALAVARRERVGVVLVARVLLGELSLDLGARL